MIKSFTIDHTKLEAPTIRLADVYERNGVKVIKWDLRFLKPNTTYFEDKIMHSMEHLLATAFKEVFGDDMIDLSPMGCKTGFYFTKFESTSTQEKIREAIRRSIDLKIPEKFLNSEIIYRLNDKDDKIIKPYGGVVLRKIKK